ncbi:MAG: hypothetical protein IVW55_07415 [Chloroflexi bacterium]|nr:hypothetical protein [Chloroflexota bacterium]
MAKQGQHNNDSDDKDVSKGPNNPSKSVTITTGAPKKEETYKEEAADHKADNKRAQAARREWDNDTRNKPSIENSTRARDADISGGRSGSDSNADRGTEGH